MEGYFKKEDLRICDAQYTTRHTNVNCFVRGEKVFLKSNPEHPMIAAALMRYYIGQGLMGAAAPRYLSAYLNTNLLK